MRDNGKRPRALFKASDTPLSSLLRLDSLPTKGFILNSYFSGEKEAMSNTPYGGPFAAIHKRAIFKGWLATLVS